MIGGAVFLMKLHFFESNEEKVIVELGEAEMIQKHKTQVIVEYVLVFAVVVLALIASNFLGRAKGAFQQHFDTCKDNIPGVGN